MLPYTAVDIVHVLQRSLSASTSGPSSHGGEMSSRVQHIRRRAASMLTALL